MTSDVSYGMCKQFGHWASKTFARRLVRLSVDEVGDILTDNRCTNESATGFTPRGGTLVLLFQGGHFGHRQSHRLDNSLQCQKANAWIAIPNP